MVTQMVEDPTDGAYNHASSNNIKGGTPQPWTYQCGDDPQFTATYQ